MKQLRLKKETLCQIIQLVMLYIIEISGSKILNTKNIICNAGGIYNYKIKALPNNIFKEYICQNDEYEITVYIKNTEEGGLKSAVVIKNEDGLKANIVSFRYAMNGERPDNSSSGGDGNSTSSNGGGDNNGSKSNVGIVNTGDNSNMFPWIVCFVISFLMSIFIMILIWKKEKCSEER